LEYIGLPDLPEPGRFRKIREPNGLSAVEQIVPVMAQVVEREQVGHHPAVQVVLAQALVGEGLVAVELALAI
jgi:hypothetical protein